MRVPGMVTWVANTVHVASKRRLRRIPEKLTRSFIKLPEGRIVTRVIRGPRATAERPSYQATGGYPNHKSLFRLPGHRAKAPSNNLTLFHSWGKGCWLQLEIIRVRVVLSTACQSFEGTEEPPDPRWYGGAHQLPLSYWHMLVIDLRSCG